MSKWTYLGRTTLDIKALLEPLEEVFRHKLLPALTGEEAFSDPICDLIALPARLGGMEVFDPSKRSTNQYLNSKSITAPLTTLILQQSATCSPETERKRHHRKMEAEDLSNRLPLDLQRAIKVSSEKGASTWLTTLPIADHAFMHPSQGCIPRCRMSEIGWTPKRLPSRCVCDQNFTIEHALSCHRGGFPSIRHS